MNKGYQKGVFRAQLCQSIAATLDQNREFAVAEATMAERYGLFTRPPVQWHADCPFDFITDMYRGFSQIPLDIRRQPENCWRQWKQLEVMLFDGETPLLSPWLQYIMTHMAASC